jgi:hypothetical protein
LAVFDPYSFKLREKSGECNSKAGYDGASLPIFKENEQQYNTRKEWLQKFEKSVAEIDGNETLKADSVGLQLYHDAYQSQIDEFEEEIAEYERLINCDKSKSIQIKMESFNKLPDGAAINIKYQYNVFA